MAPSKKSDERADGVVTLKSVADHVGLTPGTVSAVLNNAPSSKNIPEKTRDRIRLAAVELDYRPNYFARSLRKKRTYTVGVIAHEIGDGYSSMVIAGIENYAREKEYFFITGIHRHDPELFEKYSQLLLQRGAEGIITIDLNLQNPLLLPTVAVAGHRQYEGITNIVLDHRKAASLALKHLVDLGHRDIAVLKGNPASSDAVDRWDAISQVAQEMGIAIAPELALQIDSLDSSPRLGYPYGKQLLATKRRFTALFAYNDISAIGSMRAFQEAGLQVPKDISVVGFDDIQGAAFHYPSLTTVRQPLREMGETAMKTLLERIEGREDYPKEIAVQPELVIRESTGPAPA
ncbi:MAG TPA: LacI family DNA-binding transcriptional regulator [Terriglobales bacterium]|nr:LacI family DNA-binding transcriptional regulator [Terriglobales bacterium]